MSKEELNCLSAGLGCCSCNLPRQPLSEAVSLAVLGARCFHHVLVHLHSKILKICLPWPHSLQSIVLVTESKSHHHVLNCLLFASLAFPAGDGSRAACTAGYGQAAARFGNVVTPAGPSAAMPGTAQGSTGCSVPSTPSSWCQCVKEGSVGFPSLWRGASSPQAATRPQGQLLQFVVSTSAREWAESPAQVCGAPVASSCAVSQQLLC